MPEANCNTCGTPLLGKYCYNCGEKKLQTADFSIKKFVTSTVDVFTHFDGKFFLSFKYLLFYPGKLTKEFIAGRRVKLMKPVQLYIVIAIVFFILFKNWDILFNRLQFALLQKGDVADHVEYYQVSELKSYQRWLRDIVQKKAEKNHLDFNTQLFRIDEGLPEKSKAFSFLLIPMVALGVFVVGYWRYKYFAIHLVHATHLICFLFSLTIIWVGACMLWSIATHNPLNFNFIFIILHLVFLVYLFFSLRNVLAPKNPIFNFINTAIVMAVYIGAILVYRNLITNIATLMA